jgi:phenylacetic acid degradation operon negative regulatory protein
VTAVNNARYLPRPIRDEPLSAAQPRQLIVTVFGLYARQERDWLPIAAVVRLLAGLGIDSPAVRSSISRLKRRDVLRSQSIDGAAGYALSPSMLQVLAEGDRRIFELRQPRLADGWVQVVFTVPETERGKRHELRSTLARLGFGPVAPGVWLAPGRLAGEAREVLARRQLAGYVDIFGTEYLGYAELPDRVRQWWDLDELAAGYDRFVAHYGRIASDGDRAFAEYVQMLTSWRRLRYRDPGLPAEVLPTRWPGGPAAELFAELSDVLRPLAHRHAMAVIHG